MFVSRNVPIAVIGDKIREVVLSGPPNDSQNYQCHLDRPGIHVHRYATGAIQHHSLRRIAFLLEPERCRNLQNARLHSLR